MKKRRASRAELAIPDVPSVQPESLLGAHSPVPLTFLQVRFCNRYLEHGSAAKAARECGLFKGASDENLRLMASQMLTQNAILTYLREAMGQFLDHEKVTRPAIAQALVWEAFEDRTGIFDDDGNVLNPKQWPKPLRMIVSSFEVVTRTDRDTGEVTTTYKVKFASSTDAKRILAEYRGMIGSKAQLEQLGDGEEEAGVTVILQGSPTDGQEADDGSEVSGE